MGHGDVVCVYPASASLQVSHSMLIKITTLQETSSAETLLQYIWLTKKKASFIWKIAPGTPDHLCSMEQEGHDFRVKPASSASSLTSCAHTTSQLLKPNRKSGRMTVESFGTNQVPVGKMQFASPQCLSCNSSNFFGEIFTRVQFSWVLIALGSYCSVWEKQSKERKTNKQTEQSE